MIDIHIHGTSGIDSRSLDERTVENLERVLLRKGITGFLPTFYSIPFLQLRENLLFYREYIRKRKGRTSILGVNLEGPFLNKNQSGAHDKKMLTDFSDMQKNFNNQKLDLIKEEFEARKIGSQDSIDQVAVKLKKWQRKRYLYMTNFAVNNADYEVAPYVALTELVNANIKLLDTVNKSMSPEVRASKYGQQLVKFVEDIKSTEGQ